MSKAFDEVGVVGAGLMGAEIALVHALAGCRVRLVDRTSDALTAALARLGTLLDKGVARGLFTAAQKSLAFSAITPETELAALRGCSYVTEAVFELALEGVSVAVDFPTEEKGCEAIVSPGTFVE